MANVADLLIQILHQGGIRRVYGMWLLKAVLNGRGDQVVDLARTNLLR